MKSGLATRILTLVLLAVDILVVEMLAVEVLAVLEILPFIEMEAITLF
jgi:hypothetical protein